MSDSRIWIYPLTGWIFWRLREDGPTEIPIAMMPNWSLVVPTTYAPLAGTIDMRVSSAGETLIGRQELVMRHSGADESESALFAEISKLLRVLRFLSHQQTVPRTMTSAMQPMEWPPEVGHVTTMSSVSLRDYCVHCAVTHEHLGELSTISADFSIPVHVDVLLDALEAHVEHDYRRAILYSALAVETFALDDLDKAYSDVLVNRDISHRVQEIPGPGGLKVVKDPIYDAISAGDNFARLLHERPLYLKNRSLLEEDDKLYRRALSVYGTRNKIAHKGTPPNDPKHLPLSDSGAVEALETAIAVFRWLGDHGPYVPYQGLVAFPAGEGTPR